MSIGDTVKQLRKSRGLSQDDLARLVGYASRSSINKIELGKRDIPRKYLPAFSSALGVSLDYLMGESEDHDLEVISDIWEDLPAEAREKLLTYAEDLFRLYVTQDLQYFG